MLYPLSEKIWYCSKCRRTEYIVSAASLLLPSANEGESSSADSALNKRTERNEREGKDCSAAAAASFAAPAPSIDVVDDYFNLTSSELQGSPLTNHLIGIKCKDHHCMDDPHPSDTRKMSLNKGT